MLVVETVAKIRRLALMQGMPIKAICRELGISRKVVRKGLRGGETAFSYERTTQPHPKLGPWQDRLDGILLANDTKPSRERLTLIRIYEDLHDQAYEGGYDAVGRYARKWSKERGSVSTEAYVPLYYAPGEAHQLDWSHEIVVLNSVTTMVKVAHVRLCHSRMMSRRKAAQLSDLSACGRPEGPIRERRRSRWSSTLMTEHSPSSAGLVRVASMTARRTRKRSLSVKSGNITAACLTDVQSFPCRAGDLYAGVWLGERTGRDTHVNLVRERFFTPRLRFKSYGEMNGWLLDKYMSYARAHKHVDQPQRTVWDVFEEERPNLIGYPGKFDSFHAVQAATGKTLPDGW